MHLQAVVLAAFAATALAAPHFDVEALTAALPEASESAVPSVVLPELPEASGDAAYPGLPDLSGGSEGKDIWASIVKAFKGQKEEDVEFPAELEDAAEGLELPEPSGTALPSAVLPELPEASGDAAYPDLPALPEASGVWNKIVDAVKGGEEKEAEFPVELEVEAAVQPHA
ncbi:hypothetical protein IMZ48_05920 [Candidatus Bathyarchaeota archaeon]|nr:hypothetical protein [Candidatus Bathyarchaeota archaeon]